MGEHTEKSELAKELPTFLMYVCGTGGAVFMLFFFGGMYNFYRVPRLFSYVLSLDLLDGNDYHQGYFKNKSWLYYTQKCLIGTIHKYPVVIWIYQRVGSRNSETKIAITFYVMKNDKTTPLTIYIPLNWKGQPVKDVRIEATNKILMLDNTGYTYGDLSEGLEMNDTIIA